MIQIRTNIFETNSSSVHSLILCTADDYEAWMCGDKLLNMYYNDNWAWKWDKDANEYIEPPQFVTQEEAAYYDEYYPYPELTDNGWSYSDDFIDENGKYHYRKFLTFEEYEKIYTYDFETFEDEVITPKGEKIIGFGYFGRDG